MYDKLRICGIQLRITKDKDVNIDTAIRMITDTVKKHNVKMVVLPELFYLPFDVKYFERHFETLHNGDFIRRFGVLAKELNIYLVLGSIIEKCDTTKKYYNTTIVLDTTGTIVAKYRKIHLFDVDFKKDLVVRESTVLTAGHELTVFNFEGLKVGLGIGYDVRFDELTRLYRNMGVDVLIFPSVVHYWTGDLHWKLLLRARAVDTQCWVVGVTGARGITDDFVYYGRSIIVDPFGRVVTEAKTDEDIIFYDIDITLLRHVREVMPLYHQRRRDIYDTLYKKL